MSPDHATETLYLVDAHSLIFQVFHAIRGMTSPTGVPTNAVFGFVRDVLFLRSLQPTYLVCAFDRPEQYAQYARSVVDLGRSDQRRSATNPDPLSGGRGSNVIYLERVTGIEPASQAWKA